MAELYGLSNMDNVRDLWAFVLASASSDSDVPDPGGLHLARCSSAFPRLSTLGNIGTFLYKFLRQVYSYSALHLEEI